MILEVKRNTLIRFAFGGNIFHSIINGIGNLCVVLFSIVIDKIVRQISNIGLQA